MKQLRFLLKLSVMSVVTLAVTTFTGVDCVYASAGESNKSPRNINISNIDLTTGFGKIVSNAFEENIKAVAEGVDKDDKDENKVEYWAKTEKFSSSIENLKRLFTFVWDDSNGLINKAIYKKVVKRFETGIENALDNVNVENGKNDERVKKALGLINGLMALKTLYKVGNEYKGKGVDKKKCEVIFDEVWTESSNDTRYCDKLLKLLKYFGDNKNGELKKIVKHDWECYLTQFFVICNGIDKKGNKVSAVVTKVAQKIAESGNKDISGFVYDDFQVGIDNPIVPIVPKTKIKNGSKKKVEPEKDEIHIINENNNINKNNNFKTRVNSPNKEDESIEIICRFFDEYTKLGRIKNVELGKVRLDVDLKKRQLKRQLTEEMNNDLKKLNSNLTSNNFKIIKGLGDVLVKVYENSGKRCNLSELYLLSKTLLTSEAKQSDEELFLERIKIIKKYIEDQKNVNIAPDTYKEIGKDSCFDQKSIIKFVLLGKYFEESPKLKVCKNAIEKMTKCANDDGFKYTVDAMVHAANDVPKITRINGYSSQFEPYVFISEAVCQLENVLDEKWYVMFKDLSAVSLGSLVTILSKAGLAVLPDIVTNIKGQKTRWGGSVDVDAESTILALERMVNDHKYINKYDDEYVYEKYFDCVEKFINDYLEEDITNVKSNVKDSSDENKFVDEMLYGDDNLNTYSNIMNLVLDRKDDKERCRTLLEYFGNLRAAMVTPHDLKCALELTHRLGYFTAVLKYLLEEYSKEPSNMQGLLGYSRLVEATLSSVWLSRSFCMLDSNDEFKYLDVVGSILMREKFPYTDKEDEFAIELTNLCDLFNVKDSKSLKSLAKQFKTLLAGNIRLPIILYQLTCRCDEKLEKNFGEKNFVSEFVKKYQAGFNSFPNNETSDFHSRVIEVIRFINNCGKSQSWEELLDLVMSLMKTCSCQAFECKKKFYSLYEQHRNKIKYTTDLIKFIK